MKWMQIFFIWDSLDAHSDGGPIKTCRDFKEHYLAFLLQVYRVWLCRYRYYFHSYKGFWRWGCGDDADKGALWPAFKMFFEYFLRALLSKFCFLGYFLWVLTIMGLALESVGCNKKSC